MFKQNLLESTEKFCDNIIKSQDSDDVKKKSDNIESTTKDVDSKTCDEIINDHEKYKCQIKEHPLFPVLLLQYNLCNNAMYNVSNTNPISMEPMTNVSYQ
uniref:PIR Superfamily Protein n=1 Tax=Parastrongyloides trichosuri TaxID=131310 RepID=A0A0N4ZIT2_PARTI